MLLMMVSESHDTSSVLSMAPLHLLGKDDQKDIQNDILGDVILLASKSASGDENGIIKGTTAFIKSK